MTRDQLKKIVKECLVEILAEGLGGSLKEGAKPTARLQQPLQQSLQNKMPRPRVPEVPSQNSRIHEMVRSVTKDPVLASIFADTAQTTLLQQAESGHNKITPTSGDHATRVASSYDPGVLIGAMTGLDEKQQHARWAAAAFKSSAPQIKQSQTHLVQDFDPYSNID